ncbi:MAG: RluA family pseudouridine synthase [Pseudomonadota bacterium]
MKKTVETVTVKADDANIRLDRWFKRHYPALSFTALAKMCRTGQVRVDGKRAQPADRLAAGALIRVPPIAPCATAPVKAPRAALTPADVAFAQGLVIHKDVAVLVLNKPAGLATQGGPGITRHVDMLLDALKFEAEGRPKLVHRLDKDTSGVLLLGRTAGAAARLAEAFRAREAEKVYWALVAGTPKKRAGKIVMALDKRRGPAGDKVEGAEDGKPARTQYRLIDHAAQRAAWLELKPLTGRMHQLRVHCAEGLGHPIVGDGKYGGKAAFVTGGVSRKLHLHARHIRIAHPLGGWLEATAPLPPHMRESWAMLGFVEGEA